MEKPKYGELVICKITKINPHSASVFIEDYQMEGIIHISEITSGWVKSINDHVSEGQTVVAKVMSSEGNTILLSLKRVDNNQRSNKLREYKNEMKAEKMLEVAAKNIKQAQKTEEVKKALKEKFGSVYHIFENPSKLELLKEVLSEKWMEAIKEIAEKMNQDKEYIFSAKASLSSSEPDGIKRISDVLKEGEKLGFEIIYISAPEYMLKFRTKEAKKGEHEFQKKIEEFSAMAKKAGCFKDIKIIK